MKDYIVHVVDEEYPLGTIISNDEFTCYFHSSLNEALEQICDLEYCYVLVLKRMWDTQYEVVACIRSL